MPGGPQEEPAAVCPFGFPPACTVVVVADLVAVRGASAVTLIEREVIQLFALIRDGIAGATYALVSGEREAARFLGGRVEAAETRYREIDRLLEDCLCEGKLSPARTRYLLALVRMLPELERSGALADHIAQRARGSLTREMSARARGLIEQMGELLGNMWGLAADAYAEHLVAMAASVADLDEQLDALHETFLEELASGAVPVAVAVELALVGRFYERLGDHAVNLTRRIPAQSSLAALSPGPRG